MKKILDYIVDFLASIGNTIKPILVFIAGIRFYKYPMFLILWGDTSYKIKGPHMREILNIIQPGDVLLSRTNAHVFSRWGIPGYFSHSGFYVGNNKVIHMLDKGVVIEDILTFMRCDDLMVLRYCDDEENIEKAISKAKDVLAEHVQYDYNFDASSSKRFYCTEFIDYIYGYPLKDKVLKVHKFIWPDDINQDPFCPIWRKK